MPDPYASAPVSKPASKEARLEEIQKKIDELFKERERIMNE